MLKCQPCEQAADFTIEPIENKQKKADEVKLLLDAVYESDFLPVMSKAFTAFNSMLNLTALKKTSHRHSKLAFSPPLRSLALFPTVRGCLSAILN